MKNMRTSQKGIDLIKHFEGLHDGDLTQIGLQPKMCPAHIWTVGYGHALKNLKGKFFKGNESYCKMTDQYPNLLTLSEKEAEEILWDDLVAFERKVRTNLKVEVNQDQFDALVSHTFNTGGSETLFKLINEKAHWLKIYDWWLTTYITANGVKLNGLYRRRSCEFRLFNTGKLSYYA